MNVTTITIDQEEARRKVRDYAALDARTVEDELLIGAYRAAAEGQRLINIQAAFRTTGLNAQGEPRLAMARADWRSCILHPHMQIGTGWARGAALFTQNRRIDARLRTNCVSLPAQTFDADALTHKMLFSPVPHIPPRIRPKTPALRRYHILFEVVWQEYPVDPFLLRHIAGSFYAVEAEWELTTLEASLLSSLAS